MLREAEHEEALVSMGSWHPVISFEELTRAAASRLGSTSRVRIKVSDGGSVSTSHDLAVACVPAVAGGAACAGGGPHPDPKP